MDYQQDLKNRVELYLQENIINSGIFQLMSFEKKERFLELERCRYEAFLRQKDAWTEEVDIKILEEEQQKRTLTDFLIERFDDNEYFCSYRDIYNGGAPWGCLNKGL